MQHEGSCRGQGLFWDYHGYRPNQQGQLVELTCPCCELTCDFCKANLVMDPKFQLRALTQPRVECDEEVPRADCSVHCNLSTLQRASSWGSLCIASRSETYSLDFFRDDDMIFTWAIIHLTTWVTIHLTNMFLEKDFMTNEVIWPDNH